MDKKKTIKIDAPAIEGCDCIFVLTLNIGPDGLAKVAFDSAENANLEKIAIALREFADWLQKGAMPQA